MDTFRTMLAWAVTVGVLLLSGVTVVPAAAATRTWAGGTGGVWSLGTNWVGGNAPVDGDDLVFDATGSNDSVNDLTIAVNTITVSVVHAIDGTAFTVTSGISVIGTGSLGIVPTVTLGGDQTWSAAGGGLTVDALDLNNHTWTADAATIMTATTVSGVGAIIKNGSGTLRLWGDSTFDGPVTANTGTLEIRTPLALGGADGTDANGTTIAAGARLHVNSAALLTLAGEALKLSGTGAGAGALTVASTNPVTFTGPITLDATSAVDSSTGADKTLIFNGPINGPGDLHINGDTIAVFGALGSTVPAIGFVNPGAPRLHVGVINALNNIRVNLPAGATLDITDSGTGAAGLDGAGTVLLGATNGALIVKNTLPSTFTGTIEGAGGTFFKDGPGTFTLGGANTYGRETFVYAGVLRVTNPASLGLGDATDMTATIVSDGGTLALDGVAVGLEKIQVAGTTQQAILQVMGTNPSSLAGPLTIMQQAAVTGTDGATLTLTGDFQAPMALGITNATLRVMNNMSGVQGPITVNAGGGLAAGAAGVFSTFTKVVLNGGTFAPNGNSVLVGALSGSGVVAFGTNGALQVSMTTDATLAATSTGTGTFTKSGGGVLTLTNAFAVTGNVNVNGGSLVIAHDQALLPTPRVNVAYGGMLKYAVAATVPYRVSYMGTGNAETAGSVQVLGGDVTFSGQFGTDGFHEAVRVNAPHTMTWTGSITAITLHVMGTGIAVIGGSGHTTTLLRTGATPITNTNVGPTTVKVGAAGALPPVDIMVNEGSTFDLNGFDQTLKYVGGMGTVAIGAKKLTIQTGSQFDGIFTGNGTIDSTGERLELSGLSTFSGSVTSHRFSNSGTLPASVHVTEEQVYLLPNSVTGPVSVDPGVFFIPGGDPFTAGTATTGSISVPAGATFSTQVHNAAVLKVNGTVTLGGELRTLLHPTVSTLNKELTLIDNDGTDPIVGMFSDQSEGTVLRIDEASYRISYMGGDGNDVTLTKQEAIYFLSEGATGAFFDTDLLIANPHDENAAVDVEFYREGGELEGFLYNIPPKSRLTIRVDELPDLESATFSTIVRSRNTALNLIVERTMRWDATGYGAHTEKATSGPALKWYFAEGSEGFFRTYLLLANPDFVPSTATVTYLREGEPAITRTYELDADSRRTIQAADDPELVGRSFGITVEFTRRGIAERAMYFGENPTWKGGHESLGETVPSPNWFLAEGATGAGFDTFILVANPNVEPVDVTYTFLSDSVGPATVTKTIEGMSRLTVNIEAEGLGLPDGPVATQISATRPVIAERAQYWPLSADSWTEAHNSFGVTEPGTKWGLAEGRAGGPESYQTYILLANAGTEDAHVTLEFLADDDSDAPPTMTINVPAKRRVNVPIDPTGEPDDPAATFGTIITSDKPIVVERAMYWNVNGEVWAAGTNATATRLPE
jgi:autotransporter-associated beta strand protein